MNIYLLTLIAAACNVGTIVCIKKCKHAIGVGDSVWIWIAGIAVTILATQFLLLWADLKGASLGLAVSVVIILVMISAAFMSVDAASGRLMLSLQGIPVLQVIGYALAVAGVLLVGIAQQQSGTEAGQDKPVPSAVD